jgi:hypothetical protein
MKCQKNTETSYVLTLTEQEARDLFGICGHVSGSPVAYDLVDAFDFEDAEFSRFECKGGVLSKVTDEAEVCVAQ